MDKLAEIIRYKRREVEARLRPVSDSELERYRLDGSGLPDFGAALRRIEGRLALIAEIKRRSPSAGAIAELPHVEEQARRYVKAGVDAMSVLTDEKYFGGSLADLEGVTRFLRDCESAVPCLRKDFMVHPVQIVEAARAGARCILIIVRALVDDEIRVLFEAARCAGLEAIFEVHSESELDRAMGFGPRIIGVNNRDLSRFETNLEISEALIPQVPDSVVAVSESGIWGEVEARRAADCGADAILVGESLMRSADLENLAASLRAVVRSER